MESGSGSMSLIVGEGIGSGDRARRECAESAESTCVDVGRLVIADRISSSDPGPVASRGRLRRFLEGCLAMVFYELML